MFRRAGIVGFCENRLFVSEMLIQVANEGVANRNRVTHRITSYNVCYTKLLRPTAAVCGQFFAHPESRYFSLEKISKDQVEDYAKRKGVSVDLVEQFLPVNINYKGV